MHSLQIENARRQVDERLHYLAKYDWIHNIQVTKFFVHRWWEKFPQEWSDALLKLSYQELNALPFGCSKNAWPPGLNEFTASSNELCLDRTVPDWVKEAHVVLEANTLLGMTPKKAHEVSRLAGVVVEHSCRRCGCEAVIDIGSGLGHLGRCLALQCGVRVVGVEAKPELTESAQRMMQSRKSRHQEEVTRKSHHQEECSGIALSTAGCCHGDIPHPPEHGSGMGPSNVTVPLCLDGTPHSREQMATLLHQIESESVSRIGVGMVGLHCCGDLTPLTEQLFVSHPSLHCLVLVGCCYHRMSQANTQGGYNYFPLSTLVKERMQAEGYCVANTLAMRLAAQETRESFVSVRWRKQSDGNHSNHEKQMAFRAIAEAVLSDKYPSLDRRIVRQASYLDIESFAESLSTQMKDPSIKGAVLSYHRAHSHCVPYVEPFTALQTCVQGVMEGLIVLDRCVYLWEQGLQAEALPLFDEDMSPRCVAVLATRYNTHLNL